MPKLKKIGGDFIDAQIVTPHLKSMGAKEIKREQFLGYARVIFEKRE